MREMSISDLKSGFLIFLIALPLSLGIAMASSCPPISGVITAIIGGMLATFLGSARLSIKGPAAGLIVIVLGAVAELGNGDALLGYKQVLAVGFVSAILQIVLSRVKAGKIGSMMPPSVIHGMLAAIGIIIVAKQIHILLGVLPHSKAPLELIAEIPTSLVNANPAITLIGALTLITVLFVPVLPKAISKKMPAALIALFLVVPLGLYMRLDQAHDYLFWGYDYHVGPDFLVQLPPHLLQSITFPDFSALLNPVAWKYVIMLALVGSLESLLTVAAIGSVDPKKRTSNLDADLFSVGVANLVSALIGGLPMISEVVRSKANIDNGADSRWANFFHGAFLLIAVAFCADLIHEIPLSALAAMLILTGLRLSSPKEFYKTYLVGLDQIVIFCSTLMVTLMTDLLLGVLTGLVVKMMLHCLRGVPFLHLFRLPIQTEEREDKIILHLRGASALFSNYLYLFGKIQKALAKEKKVVLDVTNARMVDHTTLLRLRRLSETCNLELIGLEGLIPVSSHELATHKAALTL